MSISMEPITGSKSPAVKPARKGKGKAKKAPAAKVVATVKGEGRIERILLINASENLNVRDPLHPKGGLAGAGLSFKDAKALCFSLEHESRQQFIEYVVKNVPTLATLADTIREKGLLQPIGVAPSKDGGYAIVFGGRRYWASIFAKLTYAQDKDGVWVYDTKGDLTESFIDAVVQSDKPLSFEAASLLGLIENAARDDANVVSEARAIEALSLSMKGRKKKDPSSRAVGARIGKSHVSVQRARKIMEMPSELRDKLESGGISLMKALKELKALNEPEAKPVITGPDGGEGDEGEGDGGGGSLDIAGHVVGDFITYADPLSLAAALAGMIPSSADEASFERFRAMKGGAWDSTEALDALMILAEARESLLALADVAGVQE